MNFRALPLHSAAAALIAASATPAFALSTSTHGKAVVAEDSAIFNTVAGAGLIGGFAIAGLVMVGIGAYRIYNARAERRATPPTAHIKYSEGIWRILVGLGLVINGIAAVAL